MVEERVLPTPTPLEKDSSVSDVSVTLTSETEVSTFFVSLDCAMD